MVDVFKAPLPKSITSHAPTHVFICGSPKETVDGMTDALDLKEAMAGMFVLDPQNIHVCMDNPAHIVSLQVDGILQKRTHQVVIFYLMAGATLPIDEWIVAKLTDPTEANSGGGAAPPPSPDQKANDSGDDEKSVTRPSAPAFNSLTRILVVTESTTCPLKRPVAKVAWIHRPACMSATDFRVKLMWLLAHDTLGMGYLGGYMRDVMAGARRRLLGAGAAGGGVGGTPAAPAASSWILHRSDVNTAPSLWGCVAQKE